MTRDDVMQRAAIMLTQEGSAELFSGSFIAPGASHDSGDGGVIGGSVHFRRSSYFVGVTGLDSVLTMEIVSYRGVVST